MSFQCHICGKGYTSKFNYQYHYAHHFDERPFACTSDGCSSTYKTKADLRQHEKSHEKALGIKFVCGECQTIFDSSTRLNVHKRDFHTTKETSKWCELCNKTFTSLRNHRQTVHENIRRFSCDLDGKQFARMAGLIRHIESVHLKLSPFSCPSCNKKFKEASALKKHTKVHQKLFQAQRSLRKLVVNPENCSEDEEIALKRVRFKCGSCNRSYSSKDLMIRHQSVAHADCPYSCDVCGQRFVSRQKINFHIRNHRDCNRSEQFMAVTKLYKCGVCKQLISSKNALERHKSTVHFDIYDFMCEICSARFRDRSSLNKHHLKHHRMAVDSTSEFVCLHCGMRFITNLSFERHGVGCRQQQESIEVLKPQTTVDKQDTKNRRSVRLTVKQEQKKTIKSIIEVPWDCEIKIEPETFEDELLDGRQDLHCMKQEVIHRELIQCKLCPLLLDSTEEFKTHFLSKHVRLQNVSFKAAKKLNKPVTITGIDYGVDEQPPRSFVKFEPAFQKECEFNEPENVEALENELDHSEGEPDELDEKETLLMMQGRTFNASTSRFECRICSDEFGELELLKFHCMKTHRVHQFKCKHCNHSFDSNVAIQSHWRDFHAKDGGLFKDSFISRDFNLPCEEIKCKLCAKMLSTRTSLKRHLDLVHNAGRTEMFCDQCGESFKNIRTLRKHITKRHTDILDTSKPIIRRRKTTKRRNCEDCGEEVFGQLGLAQHWWNVHKNIKIVDKTRYHCLICRQVMNTRATAMRHHVQVHQDGQVLHRSCRVCELDFQLYDDFKSHVDSYHLGGNTCICLVCGTGFDASLDLFKHSKLHRAVPECEKKLKCDLCGFRAQQKVTIETHMSNSHHGSRKAYSGNTCEYCGVFFKCYQSFYTHLKNSHPKSSKDSSKYACSFCGKTYKYSRDWRNHELVHLDPEARQFQCDYEDCGRKYTSYCSFKGHVKYAHDSSRNKCRLCQEYFQSRVKVIAHMEQAHPETRKFSCNFCGRSFKSQITQLRHIKLCVNGKRI